MFVSCHWGKTKNFKLTPWACCEIFVRSSDDSPCSGSSELTVRVANSRKAHSNLIVSSSSEYIVSYINVLKVSSLWPMSGDPSVTFMRASSELAVRSNSSQCCLCYCDHPLKCLNFTFITFNIFDWTMFWSFVGLFVKIDSASKNFLGLKRSCLLYIIG